VNLVLLDPSELEERAPGELWVRLRGRRFEHVRDVHRARAGDALRVGVLGGGVGSGRILGLGDDWVELRVAIDAEPPEPIPVALVIALPRPLVLKRVLAHAASLGVKRIALIHARRVEKSYWQSGVVSRESLLRQLLLGLEQAGDTVLPAVSLHRRFRPFSEDELPVLLEGSRGIVAHPEATLDCPRGVRGRVTLAVGPEGGFLPYEIERLEAAGMTAVRLGRRIMRVEAAVPYAIARLT
jgi:RsmE family RNA methyltransferase